VISYLPWLKILIASVGKVSSSWWATSIPSFKECLDYMIGTDIFAKCLIAIFGVLSVKFQLASEGRRKNKKGKRLPPSLMHTESVELILRKKYC
jgi:hypothetical protein